jgi:ribonuclease P protein component
MKTQNSFSKLEHLCGEKRISHLFQVGEAFISFPVRVVYLIEPKTDEVNASVLVNVPKKRFKRAVKRNRLKRLMREAYRLNKQILIEKLDEKQLQIHVAFNYVADEEIDFVTIERKLKSSLQKLIDKIETL